MRTNYSEIERVIKQSNKWIKFGVISPVLFFLTAFILNYNEMIDMESTFWISVIVTGIICFIWWFWALRVIICMGKLNRKVNEDLTETIKSIKMVRQEVKETTEEIKKLIKK